ncbi:MAG: zinc ribbon domain-containing protein [Cyanobacteria bacterium J06635_10]
MGRQNNYEVVMMPTAKLIKRLGELCDENGIRLHVTSEEYTSKASFKHRAVLPKYGEKPDDWNPCGKRSSRDVYTNEDGSKVHADINAASNILRKVADKIFVGYSSNFQKRAHMGRVRKLIINGAMTDPKRYSLYEDIKTKKYRRAALAPVGTSV